MIRGTSSSVIAMNGYDLSSVINELYFGLWLRISSRSRVNASRGFGVTMQSTWSASPTILGIILRSGLFEK